MIVFRNSLALMMLFFYSVAGIAQSDFRPEVANHVIAYKGQQGTIVWTLRIGERSANESLVQVEGIDHDWDLKIQKMSVEKTNKDTRYYIDDNGKKFIALIIKDKCCGELYLPGEPQPIYISYSEVLSNQGNAQAFLTDYMQQKNKPYTANLYWASNP